MIIPCHVHLVLLLFATILHVSFGLRCFNCTSEKTCPDAKRAPVETCTQPDPVCLSFEGHQRPSGCIPRTGWGDHDKFTAGAHKCISWMMINRCTCDYDLCNGSENPLTPFGVLLGVTLVVMRFVVHAYFWD